MANAASVTLTATILPDEIAKTISGAMTVTPGTNEKWYYKLTSVLHSAGTADLIGGSFLSPETVGTGHDTVSASDRVKFLFVKNTDDDDGLVISFAAGTAAYDLADTIFVGPGESWFGRPHYQTLVSSIHAIAADVDSAGEATIEVIVAAIIEDV